MINMLNNNRRFTLTYFYIKQSDNKHLVELIIDDLKRFEVLEDRVEMDQALFENLGLVSQVQDTLAHRGNRLNKETLLLQMQMFFS